MFTAQKQVETQHILLDRIKAASQNIDVQYMRRSDREITNFNEIVNVLYRANTIRLGMFDGEYPYVIPLSYGFETSNGCIVLYIHGAKEGLKHDLLVRNNRVCVETDIFHRYVEISGSILVEYESVIGFGIAETVVGAEATHGLDLLLIHCGYSVFEYDKSALDAVKVMKITLTQFTGKRRFVNDGALAGSTGIEPAT